MILNVYRSWAQKGKRKACRRNIADAATRTARAYEREESATQANAIYEDVGRGLTVVNHFPEDQDSTAK
jgi:hypothetical protein